MVKLMDGLARILLLCAVVLALPYIAVASSISVDVDSRLGWQSTSLTVSQGQLITFSAVGSWTVDFRNNNFPYVGPDGYKPEVDSRIFQGCKLDPKLPYARLLARIGTDPSWSVGRGGTFTARSSGVLSLRIHDADACQGDNDGFMKVTVTISAPSIPPPTSTELPPFYCITGPNGQPFQHRHCWTSCQNVDP